MAHITITRATINDLAVIQQVGQETFFETFVQSNTEADMKKYLAESFNDEKVKAELANPDSLFFIAWEEGNPIGYLKVNTGNAQTDLQDVNALEIERIYVKSAYHGKKVGNRLYEKALEVAQSLQKSYMWLGVWEENPRAIRFYEKNGFVAFDKHLFMLGDDAQTDILMRKPLD
jgi:ribosomal protein S18 acetylase RimI-like enzyme